MVTVQLTREETALGKLPLICMRCGAPAERLIQNRFSKWSMWIVLILFPLCGPIALLFVAAHAPAMTVHAPVCLRHQNHWFKRRLLNCLLSLSIFWIIIANLMLPTFLKSRGWRRADVETGLGVLVLLLIIGWFILIAVLDAVMIGAESIDRHGITLRNVHPSFGDALLQQRTDRRNSERPTSERGQHDLPPTNAS
jgi:hypothetical protein